MDANAVMPFSATVFHVLIASPSDVPEEREAIARVLHEWNALNSQTTGSVLLPVMWESHSAPMMGDRPQGIINDQVVRSCDMLIGAFWTRLGSPTGIEESGTVEEIRWFLKQNKPVMLYYSKRPVDLDTIDISQLDKLKSFKASIRDKGIQEQYTNIGELNQKLFRQLTIVMRGMSVGTVLNKKVVQEALNSTNDTNAANMKIITSKVDDNKLRLADYSEKSFVVLGNTMEWKGKFLDLRGKYISLRGGGKAWNFSKRRLEEVANMIGLPAELEPYD